LNREDSAADSAISNLQSRIDQMKLLLLVPAAALVALGGEGLYHAFRGRERVAIDCQALVGARPSSHRLLVTGCEVDYAGVGYRGNGQIEELFFPARPAGRAMAAPIVIVTRDPAALSLAQPVLGSGQRMRANDAQAVLKKIVEVARAAQSIDGLARAGIIERVRTRRILSGLTATPVASDAMLIDLEGAPDFVRPMLALAGGLLLAAMPFLLSRRRREAHGATAEPVSNPHPAVLASLRPAPAIGRASDPLVPMPPAVSLPRLLLLNVGTAAGPDAVETAPPLGKREAAIEILCGVVPDLGVDAEQRVLSRADGSLRIDLGRYDPVPTAVVEARGEAGAALVKEILLMTGWRAFAPKTGLFVSGDELTVMAALTRGDA
jgi:hypothetical protein